MRKASPERPKVGQPVGGRDNPNGEAAIAKSKEKKRSKKKKKKALKKKSEAEKEASEQEKKEGVAGLACNGEKQTALDLLNNPEAKGRGLAAGHHGKREQVTRSQATSGGECSGQKTPDGS